MLAFSLKIYIEFMKKGTLKSFLVLVATYLVLTMFLGGRVNFRPFLFKLGQWLLFISEAGREKKKLYEENKYIL